MSSQGEYYDVQKFGDEWVAMYDPEQQLMGKSFKTEAEARAYVEADMNPTDTNQASETELDKALGYMTMVWDESSVFGQPPDYSHIYLTGKQEAKEAIQALIRTEKLKLLADVRERVVGEDEKPNGFSANRNSKKNLRPMYKNQLRAEQREQLTKLEAEL